MKIPLLLAGLLSRQAPAPTPSANGPDPLLNVSTTLIVPTCQPGYAEPLDPHLASLSIELDNFPIWTGESLGEVNNYTVQLLENLAERTGRGVWIRVGGNTEDRTRVNLDVPVWDRSIPPPTNDIPYHEANAVTIGRDFYALSSHFPRGTKFTWGLNLRSMNITETSNQAKHLSSSFQREELAHVELAGVEIGNEVDGFQVTPYTNLSFTEWTPYNYTNTWSQFASNVSSVLGLEDKDGGKGPGLQVGSFMSSGNAQPWNPLNVLGTGVMEKAGVRGIKWWSDHFYTGVWGMGSPPSPGSLMTKGSVRGVLSQRMVDIGTAKRSGLKYIVGETNSFANHGAPGLSNTAEAAIWAVDYMLQAATLGVSRVHFHNGLGYRYNVFQPIAGLDDGTNLTSRAHILPLYHAFLIVNEAIGNGNEAYVAEMGTLDRTLAAYGIWEGREFKRMVMIHSGLYQTGQRGRLDVELQGLEGRTLRVKRLRTPRTESFNGLTWGGQSFEMSDGKPIGSEVEQVLDSNVLTLQSSEVVLVTIE